MLDEDATFIRVGIRAFEREYGSTKELFANTSINKHFLDNNDSISAQDSQAITRNFIRVSGDPAWVIKFVSKAHIIIPGLCGAAANRAPTLRAGLQLLATYSKVVNNSTAIELQSDFKSLKMYMTYSLSEPDDVPLHLEAFFILLKRYVEFMTGQALINAEFHFAYDEPDYVDYYHASFNNKLVFNSSKSFVLLRELDFDTLQPFYNRSLWEVSQSLLLKQLDELQKLQHTPYTEHVLTFLRSSSMPLPDISQIANEMCMSKRTLNRRLKHEQTSFKTLRRQEQHNRALQSLKNSNTSIESLSLMLGYQDVANFRRAFRSIEGCSPSEYRLSQA